jgi:hypothetical protein
MKRTNLLSNQHPNLPSKKKIESGVDEQQPRGGFFSRMFSKKKTTSSQLLNLLQKLRQSLL